MAGTNKVYSFSLDESLSFKADNYVIDKYLREGWSVQEPKHRWTEGARADLQLHIPEIKTKSITLRVECSGFLANDKLTHQSVDVLVKGEKVATWSVGQLDWYEAVIQRELVKEGVLNLALLISDPTSPLEVGMNEDGRMLGLCVKSLEIIESGAKLDVHPEKKSGNKVESNHLNFGENLSFERICAVSRYLRDGWAGQEPGHRWSEGDRAVLKFHVHAIGDRNCIMRVKCAGFLANNKFEQQSVAVLVNTKKIADWALQEQYEDYDAAIPHELIKNGNFEVTFLISHPTSPSEVGISEDARKLGMSIQSLMIVVDPKQIVAAKVGDITAKRKLSDILRGKVSRRN